MRANIDRSNYLLTKHTKIIAMTCTHAALKVYFIQFIFLNIIYIEKRISFTRI